MDLQQLTDFVEVVFSTVDPFLPLPIRAGSWLLKRMIIKVILPKVLATRGAVGAAPDQLKELLHSIFEMAISFFGEPVRKIAEPLYDLMANKLWDAIWDRLVAKNIVPTPTPAPDAAPAPAPAPDNGGLVILRGSDPEILEAVEKVAVGFRSLGLDE